MVGFERFECGNLEKGEVRPSDAIMEMFCQTGKDGALTMPAWARSYQDAFGESKDETLSCRMHWTEQDAVKLSEEVDGLFGMICEIGKKLGEQPEDFCDYEKILSQEQLQVPGKYLYAFETGVNEKDLKDYFAARADFADLNDRQKAVEEEYLNDCRKDAEQRVGKAPYAYEVVLYAQRLNTLARIGAPYEILLNESLAFAQSMALHRFSAVE